MTVLAAGPGWGKTTAVARWLATTTLPSGLAAGWLTLTPGLDDVASFWDGVLRAVNASGAVPADSALSSLSPMAGVTDDMLKLLHGGLSSIPGRVLLVLDDFHVIDDQEVLDAVAELVARHATVSVMLLSRVQPVLALHRLRLTGELLEIMTADLALDGDEIAGLGRSVGLLLSDDEVAAVLERTQGWPAGVRLAALHLSRQGPERDVATFGGIEHSVAEYLLAEVLERNTPESREFLMRTSVCDPVCADLAEAIAPGHRAQSLLEGFEGHNEFVAALGADRVWFRYTRCCGSSWPTASGGTTPRPTVSPIVGQPCGTPSITSRWLPLRMPPPPRTGRCSRSCTPRPPGRSWWAPSGRHCTGSWWDCPTKTGRPRPRPSSVGRGWHCAKAGHW